jgi:mannosyltransferase OCH1-like enzyme
MIPKKIHYCWLSGEKKPMLIKKCIESWQKIMPDYEVKLWDTSNFEIKSNNFVYEAYKEKKWAFVCDYIRLWALYNEGGVYLDSDVSVLKSFNEFLSYDFFSAVEYHNHIIKRENSGQYLNSDGSRKKGAANVPGIGMQAAVFGCASGHQFVKACMDYYENHHFVLENGSLNNKIIAPDIYARMAEKFGFKYKNEKQELRENMMIFPNDVFSGSIKQSSENTFAIHFGYGSWRQKPTVSEKVLKKFNQYINR